MKLLKRIAFLIAALITVATLFYAVENWRGTRDYENTRDALEALGEELDYARLIPPQVSEETNFGSAAYLQSLRREGPPGSPQAIVKTIYDAIRKVEEAESAEEFRAIARALATEIGSPATQDPLHFLAEQLEPWQAYREELVARLSLPQARWNHTLASGRQADSYVVFDISSMTLLKLIAIQARVDLLSGLGARALEDIEISLRLGEMYAQEPGMIFHVLFLADLALASNRIEEGLQTKAWTAEQLGQLGDRLRTIDFRQIFQSAIRGERAFALTFEKAATRTWRLDRSLGEDRPLWQHLAPRGWALRGLGLMAESLQEGIQNFESENMPFGAAVDAWDAALESQAEAPITAWLAADLAYKLGGLGEASLNSARKIALLRAALQIYQYELKHGRYPDSLSELPAVPLDPEDDQPLHYEASEGGFQVEAPDEFGSFRFVSAPEKSGRLE